jgi:hypothetical protein
VIALGAGLPFDQVVGAADHHYPLVVTVAREQLVAVAEEGWIRHAVVLEHDGFLDLLEHPGQPAGDAPPATEVDRSVVADHLAVRGELVRHPARGLAQARLVGVAGARTVGH